MTHDEPDAHLEDERRLVERAKAGDQDALRPLLERYGGLLYGAVILPRLHNAAAAEDVLRDTLLTAVEKINSFEWQGRSLYAWLRQIAAHKVIDAHRRNARTGRMLVALAAESPISTEPDESAEASLIAEEERRDRASRVERTLAALHPRYREVLLLRLCDELPREDCARRLGVTLGTLDVLVFRAIRSFRKRYAETGDAGERAPDAGAGSGEGGA